MTMMLKKVESKKWTLNVADLKALGINILKFTAPALVAFFSLLNQGVPFEKAWPVALVILWGVVADFFKKFSQGT